MIKSFQSYINTSNFSDSNLNDLNYTTILHNNLKGISEGQIMNLWNFTSDITHMLLTYAGRNTKRETREIDSIFPDNVTNFIYERLPARSLEKLDVMIVKIKEFLRYKNLEHSVLPELFIDPEYPDWREIRIRIKIKEDLKYIYERLEPKIYEIVQMIVPKELLYKVLIKLETF
jgi:hypothetical protein